MSLQNYTEKIERHFATSFTGGKSTMRYRRLLKKSKRKLVRKNHLYEKYNKGFEY